MLSKDHSVEMCAFIWNVLKSLILLLLLLIKYSYYYGSFNFIAYDVTIIYLKIQ